MELQSEMDAFLNRNLDKGYLVLWVDTLYEKIRNDGHVTNMAVHVVCGLRAVGTQDILAVEPIQG
ncbi:transposase [Clostridia bacterium]|nr:transposase [Clostridia bacterium]